MCFRVAVPAAVGGTEDLPDLPGRVVHQHVSGRLIRLSDGVEVSVGRAC
jgi:hypothetical protein